MRSRRRPATKLEAVLPIPTSVLLDEAECRCVAMVFLLDGEVDAWLQTCKDRLACSTALRWYLELSKRFTKKHLSVFGPE